MKRRQLTRCSLSRLLSYGSKGSERWQPSARMRSTSSTRRRKPPLNGALVTSPAGARFFAGGSARLCQRALASSVALDRHGLDECVVDARWQGASFRWYMAGIAWSREHTITHTGRQTDRRANRHTGRQIDRMAEW